MAEEEESLTSRADELRQLHLSDSPFSPSLKFLLNALKPLTSNQLTPDNFHIWSSQVQKIFRANGFASFLDISVHPPSPVLISASGVQSPNPLHTNWLMIDQNLSAALFSIISPSLLPYVLNLESTALIWQALCKRLQATNRSRVIQLKNDLHNVSLKQNSMQHYLTEIKTIVDLLAAAGASVDAEDVILYTLNGLPPIYNPFKTAIRTRLDPIGLDDFYALLCSEEVNLSNEAKAAAPPPTYALQSTTSRGRQQNYRSRGRYSYRGGRGSSRGRSSSASPVVCQICDKFGHSARQCWHRANLSFTPPTETQPSTALLTSSSPPPSTIDWYLDSGASTHLTSNYQNLHQPQPYQGTEQVLVGNGSSLPITHTGHNTIQTENRSEDQSSAYSRT